MTDYTKLAKALRCKRDDCEGCDLAFLDNDEGWMCQYAAKDDDAAAIEDLQAEQKKTVTQIFGEEQMEWEGRCKDLMKQISELQDEVEELKEQLNDADVAADDNGRQVEALQAELSEAHTTNKAFKMEIEKLQAEVKRLELDNEDYEHEHRRLKGEIEALQAQMPKRGEWIKDEEQSQKHVEAIYKCSACHNFDAWGVTELYPYCPNCGAKMMEAPKEE